MAVVQTPRWYFAAPNARAVAHFLGQQRDEPFSYREIGASRERAPAGYVLDHNRVQIGHGSIAFDAACSALHEWRMFPAPWTKIIPAGKDVRPGNVVAMLARAFGLWWLNACKIVYVVNENEPVRRVGFAYGTLPAHVEQGEERFTVELHADGAVWYDLRAFSRPRYWPVRLCRPLARQLQRRFVRESQAVMRRIAQDAGVMK